MWYVYILLCAGNTLYTGITDNLQKRFNDHKNGKGAKYTKSHKPLRIIYTEAQSTKSTALKREIEIKGWSRKMKISNLNLTL